VILDDDDDTDKVLDTSILRQMHVVAWQFLLLQCNCLSLMSLSPSYETSNDTHTNGCHKNSSSNSITALCQLLGASMTERCHDK
jgi:hypothetical protein